MTEGIPNRLQEALVHRGKKRSMRWVHRELSGLREESPTYSTVHRYFSGETEAPVSFLMDAAQILGVRGEWLLTGEVPKWPDARRRSGAARGGSSISSTTKGVKGPPHLVASDLLAGDAIYQDLSQYPDVQLLLAELATNLIAATPLEHRSGRLDRGLIRGLLRTLNRPWKQMTGRSRPQEEELERYASYARAMLTALWTSLPAVGQDSTELVKRMTEE